MISVVKGFFFRSTDFNFRKIEFSGPTKQHQIHMGQKKKKMLQEAQSDPISNHFKSKNSFLKLQSCIEKH